MRIVWISPSLLSWNLSAQGWKIVNERTWLNSGRALSLQRP
jgi:hypothetical protein